MACVEELKIDAAEGHTLSSLIYENTPPEENDTEGYIGALVKCTGEPRDKKVAHVHLGKLTRCIAKLESSAKFERL